MTGNTLHALSHIHVLTFDSKVYESGDCRSWGNFVYSSLQAECSVNKPHALPQPSGLSPGGAGCHHTIHRVVYILLYSTVKYCNCKNDQQTVRGVARECQFHLAVRAMTVSEPGILRCLGRRVVWFGICQ